MLNVSRLNKRFGDLAIFENFDLTLSQNGFTVLIGPSGCGKSTLFNVLTGAVAGDGGAISGGMRQRCALVRTLMFERDLILLDEPLSALDAITRRSLQSLLLMLQVEFKKSILMITHDIEEALRLADEILVLSGRPMRVLDRFALDGPKLRRITDPALIAIKEHVLDLLQEYTVL